MPQAFYHKSLIPADLQQQGWFCHIEGRNEPNVQEQFMLANIFSFDDFASAERFVTTIDRLELEQRIYNTVIVNPENNSVEVRLINPQYRVPTTMEVLFARNLTINYINQQQDDAAKPYLFIDFDGTVRCVVETGDLKNHFGLLLNAMKLKFSLKPLNA